MAKNRTVSPSTQGVRPAMKKMFDGRNTATRPIPVIVDTSDIRAIKAAAADAKPKTSAVQFPTRNRAAGNAENIFGTQVSAPGNVIGGRSAGFDPATGAQNFE